MYYFPTTMSGYKIATFDLMLSDLLKLNVKYLQQMLTDMSDIYIGSLSGEYNSKLQTAVESAVLERTLLK